MIHGRGFPHRAVPENLVPDYPPAVPGKFNLGLLHTSLTGREGHDTYAPCAVADLQNKGYGYWALGHIHQPEVISQDPWIVFAGNCQGRHIKETGPRGCRLVTVNDSLEVEAAEWRSLDVVRWQELKVDLAGSDHESEALARVSAAMEQAVAEAEGRLVAARIILSGSTLLHGSLHREGHRWRAEMLARAQDQGEEAVWLEQVKIRTTPVYNVALLAQRDALTRIVVEGLDRAPEDRQPLPEDIRDMLEVLPAEIRAELEAEWSGEQRAEVLKDVRAIILEALGTKGGQVQ